MLKRGQICLFADGCRKNATVMSQMLLVLTIQVADQETRWLELLSNAIMQARQRPRT